MEYGPHLHFEDFLDLGNTEGRKLGNDIWVFAFASGDITIWPVNTTRGLFRPGYPHFELTHRILGAAVDVHRELGPGFLEKVYSNALSIALLERAITFAAEAPLTVHFRGRPVGNYFADFLVQNAVICELKAMDALADIHEVQLRSYLKATNLEGGLLLNFGRATIQIKRLSNLKSSASS